ncbi:aldo/keto reductase [Streptomyces sp. NPDC057686]|uniref:aldo/keto reductase n=1 Tax=Streptomyces sp. NPDC057686 TaxID=3346212 RepID=UPI00368AE5F6
MQTTDFVRCNLGNSRPAEMPYRSLGSSGLSVSAISLILQCDAASDWSAAEQQIYIEHALMLGINHFRLSFIQKIADRYEATLTNRTRNFFQKRDEMLISADVGFNLQESPVAFGARKHIFDSLNSILQRTGLQHVDVLCAHRYDPSTPMEETMGALASAVQQGKARYVGLSGYAPAAASRAATLLRNLGTPAVACFGPFSVLHSWAEDGLLQLLGREGIGFLSDVPLPSRFIAGASWPDREVCSRPDQLLTADETATMGFAKLAAARGQSPAGLALSWVLREPRVASAVVGVASSEQLQEYCAAVDYLHFTADELAVIWACRSAESTAAFARRA